MSRDDLLSSFAISNRDLLAANTWMNKLNNSSVNALASLKALVNL